jgi:RNA polymerase sigma factor (sigma-70 family)
VDIGELKFREVTVSVGAYAMNEDRTTLAVQLYLDLLAGEAPHEPIVRALLERTAHRLHGLCANLLRRGYPRLRRPPMNMETDELLGGVIEGLLKALPSIRPQNVRHFFSIASQHMRWQLNDLARRLDAQPRVMELRHDVEVPRQESDSMIDRDGPRIWKAIDSLPAEIRETFDLVRLQALTHAEAAEIMDVTAKTIQRRLIKARILLAQSLADLRPIANLSSTGSNSLDVPLRKPLDV